MNIIVSNDLHFLSPELTDKGDFFKYCIENVDGKTTIYCEELVKALLIKL